MPCPWEHGRCHSFAPLFCKSQSHHVPVDGLSPGRGARPVTSPCSPIRSFIPCPCLCPFLSPRSASSSFEDQHHFARKHHTLHTAVSPYGPDVLLLLCLSPSVSTGRRYLPNWCSALWSDRSPGTKPGSNGQGIPSIGSLRVEHHPKSYQLQITLHWILQKRLVV